MLLKENVITRCTPASPLPPLPLPPPRRGSLSKGSRQTCKLNMQLCHSKTCLCREAGVRSLKQLLEKTYRKVALKLVRGGLSGPTPSNTQEGPAHPGDTVSEHGGVGLGDEEAPQQAPPDTPTTLDTSGESCLNCVACRHSYHRQCLCCTWVRLVSLVYSGITLDRACVMTAVRWAGYSGRGKFIFGT